MIINRIPTRIKIEVEDSDSKTGTKLIETEVLFIGTILRNMDDGVNYEQYISASVDAEGNMYSRPLDDIKIIETRKYEESKDGAKFYPRKKRSRRRGAKNSRGDNNPELEGGNESKGEGDSSRSGSEDNPDGGSS